MWKWLLAALLMVLASAVQAQGPNFRFGGAGSQEWCLFTNPYTYECSYTSAQQCGAAANGVGGICQPNPSGPPPVVVPRRVKRAKHRH